MNTSNLTKAAFLFSFITLLFLGCGNSKEIQDSGESVPHAKLVDDLSQIRNSAALTINSVLIKGNLMTLAVKYSGGCEKHEFQLLGEKNLNDSIPPVRKIALIHDNKGDSCRELVDEILVFNISELGIKKEALILELEGFSENLPYKAN